MSTDKAIHKSEVAIIGGGIIGCFIGYYLAKQGRDVVVLEQEEIGSGASGANDACLMAQSKKPGPKLSLAIESADMWAVMSDELGYDIEYCRHGSMIVCETEEQTEKMRDFSQTQIDFGLPVEILDYHQTHDFQPALSKHVLSSSYCNLDGEVNPFLTLNALTENIRKYNGRIYQHTPVRGFVTSGDSIEALVTDRGQITAPVIVAATGAYTPLLLEKLGVEINILPRRGQILISAPISPLVNGYVMAARAITAKHKPVTPDSISKPGDFGLGMIISQAMNGNMVMGVTHEFVGYNTATTIKGLTSVALSTSSVIPKLRDLQIIRAFSGLRPYSGTGLPYVERLDGWRNLYVVAGHEGDGIALAPITGKSVAKNILNGTWGG